MQTHKQQHKAGSNWLPGVRGSAYNMDSVEINTNVIIMKAKSMQMWSKSLIMNAKYFNFWGGMLYAGGVIGRKIRYLFPVKSFGFLLMFLIYTTKERCPFVCAFMRLRTNNF